jgi:hypothetical protein
MLGPIYWAYIHLSFEEVVVRVSHEVLMEVDDTVVLGVGDPQGILSEQVRPRLICLFDIIIIIIIKFYFSMTLLVTVNKKPIRNVAFINVICKVIIIKLFTTIVGV